MKNDFDELSSRLDMIEGRIFELEDVTIEALRTERQRERLEKKKKRTEYPRTVGQLQKDEHL